MTRRLLPAILALVSASAVLFAQAPIVTPHTDAPPEDLDEPVGDVLAAGGERVTVGSSTLEFWWVKSLPLRSDSDGVAWDSVEEGALVGAVSLSAPYPEAHGQTLKPGVYTLRYGVLPAEGGRPGAPGRRDFLLLSPGAADLTDAARGHDAMLVFSRLSLGGAQVASWSLEPAAGTELPRSVHDAGGGLTAVVFSVPVSRDGSDVGTLRFALVLVGELHS